MSQMLFMTIFSLLATVGMVLVIMWGMSTLAPQGQGSFQSSASGIVGERLGVYAFEPSSAEMAYRQALKELLVAHARLPTQERESAHQPFGLSS